MNRKHKGDSTADQDEQPSSSKRQYPKKPSKSKNFEKGGEYSKTWKSNDDGKVNTNGPRVVVDQGNGVGPSGGFITK
ncbi:hypothetical protein KUTeg_014249 [Tegillarca granosa]|uniref:Synaptosomal-associated protein n=1 Tax=Tegillarca granosa TaxID=220873 RepID=A0ABQ9F189_TEGGR|nr:hypothetical protein KUTeg_014249 [Tegillarca granosa]